MISFGVLVMPWLDRRLIESGSKQKDAGAVAYLMKKVAWHLTCSALS